MKVRLSYCVFFLIFTQRTASLSFDLGVMENEIQLQKLLREKLKVREGLTVFKDRLGAETSRLLFRDKVPLNVSVEEYVINPLNAYLLIKTASAQVSALNEEVEQERRAGAGTELLDGIQGHLNATEVRFLKMISVGIPTYAGVKGSLGF